MKLKLSRKQACLDIGREGWRSPRTEIGPRTDIFSTNRSYIWRSRLWSELGGYRWQKLYIYPNIILGGSLMTGDNTWFVIMYSRLMRPMCLPRTFQHTMDGRLLSFFFVAELQYYLFIFHESSVAFTLGIMLQKCYNVLIQISLISTSDWI